MATSVQPNQPKTAPVPTQEAVKPEDATTEQAVKPTKVGDKYYFFHKVLPSKEDSPIWKIIKVIACILVIPMLGALVMDVGRNIKNFIWKEKKVEEVKEEEKTDEAKETDEAKKEEETKTPEKATVLSRIGSVWTNYKKPILAVGVATLAVAGSAYFRCNLPLVNKLFTCPSTPVTTTTAAPTVPVVPTTV